MFRLHRAALVVALGLLGSPVHALTFDDRSEEFGLVELFKTEVTPVWIDLDGDQTPEPLWISHDGWFSLDMNANGGPAIREIELPAGYEDTDAGNIVLVVLDADGDQVADLMVITEGVDLYRVVAPWTFELEDKQTLSMPPASVVDAAVGDLNGDGLPDVVAGMALFRGELLPRSGHPDVALMNLGLGRFEVVLITPSVMGLSNGVTLADMDADGRLDLVESLDFTSMGDRSRILLNRTDPGSPVPIFVESEHSYDCGTYGMGAAVADVNGDGLLDIYNSSLGRDLMVLAQPDGSWLDVTNEMGLTHEWGVSGLRNQWSPMFLDLDADGLLDLYVRQGGMGVGGAVLGADSGPHLAFNERDVLYLGTAEGRFERVLTPHHPIVATMGRHGVAGDVDDDGLPDMAHGGDQGSAGFWHNHTAPSEEGRALTVRFDSTVSGWPPTGARVEALCDGQMVRRTLTSGGLMGANRAHELYLGWTECAGETTVNVRWPSGVNSSQSVADSARTVVAHEPAWWSLDPELPGTVTVDPAAAGVEQACIGSPLGQWICCQASDAPCTLEPPEAVGGSQQVKLAGELPMAVPTGAPRWTVTTSPSPPRKGETVEVYVMLQSDPRAFTQLTTGPAAPTLMHGLSIVPWNTIDESSQTLRTLVTVASDATSLDLTLFPFDLPDSPTWVLPTGSAIDPTWALQDVYPYRITGGVTEFWHIPVYSTLIRDQPPAVAMSFLELSTPDGTPMEFSLSPDPMAVSRGRFLVDPMSVLEVNSLVLRDLGGSFEETFDIFPEVSLEEATSLVDSAPGGLANTRLLEGGEESTFLFSLVDAQGRYMPPEPELITVEVDGGELIVEPSTQMAAYTMGGTIRTDPGVEPGEVRVRSLDGRLLSVFPFERRARGNSGVSPEDSEVEAFLLEGGAAPQGPGEATHTVTVMARHAIGDILGYSAQMNLSITGGTQLTEPVVGPYGAMHFRVAIADEPGELSIGVSLDGGALEPLIVVHDGHPFPSASTEIPDAVDPQEDGHGSDGAVPGEPDTSAPSRDSGGCSGGPSVPASELLWLLLLSTWAVSRRSLARVCSALLILGGLLASAPVHAVEFEDQSEQLDLATHFSEDVIPIWMDVDFDGTPEPLWIAHKGWFGVDLDESGEPYLREIDPPEGYVQTDGPDIVSAVLDADGDKNPELLLITRQVDLYRLTAPWTFERVTKRAISMPPAAGLDAAVGDLNGDGLPDVVVGMVVIRAETIPSGSGHPDIALMNLGHGRFEAVIIEPSSMGASAGVTLADIDGDGLVDLVESQDFTSLGEKSRVLLNRTSPGSHTPTFVVDEHTFDCGTYGMGAAVADVNGDGLADIYNTSLGRDLMAIRQPDGSWLDATSEFGVDHEWSLSGLRNQWSPMFLDLNADGRLDLYVRQGGMGMSGTGMGATSGALLGFNQRDLVYVGGEEGRFERVLPPYTKGVAMQGRQATAGDLDDDGLPDITHGGQAGSAGLWRNQTSLPAQSHPLTVRFESTISGWPPTGARVEGLCDDQTVRRALTSGGLIGATRATEVYLGWSSCTGARAVTVRWPSGVTTTQSVDLDARVMTAVEPAWWSLDPDQPGTVTLDPQSAGAKQACVGSPQGQWSCCLAADAPCTLAPPQAQGGSQQAKLDEEPSVALPTGAPRWTIATSPSPPRPGQSVEVYLMVQSDPREFEALTSGPSAPTLMNGLSTLSWSAVDSSAQILRTYVEVPANAPALELTLFPFDLPSDPTWTVSTASAIDPVWSNQDFYPYRITGGVTEYWHMPFYTTLLRDVPAGTVLPHLTLETASGAPVEHTLFPDHMALSRGRFLVDPESLIGIKQLVLRDTHGTYEASIEIFPRLSFEEALPRMTQVVGGLTNVRLLEDGDETSFVFSVLDAQGRFMPPEPELVTIEIDGGFVSSETEIRMSSYAMVGTLLTDPGVGSGQVKVFTKDGRLLGALPFERRARGDSGVVLSDSSVEVSVLEDEESPMGPGEATHRISVSARQAQGDLLGFNSQLDVQITGGEQVTQERIGPYGNMHLSVAVSEAPGEMIIEAFLDGAALEPLVVVHGGHPFTSVSPPDSSAPEADSDVSSVIPEPDAPITSSRDSGGCGAAGVAASHGWLSFALLCLLFLRVHARRRVSLLALCLLSLWTPIEARAVTFEDLSESTGLTDATTEGVVPVWFDVDLDGTPEPLWISYEGWYGIDLDAPGEPQLKQLEQPVGFEEVEGPVMVTVALDAMGDSHPELMVITGEVAVYRLVAPWTFEVVNKRPVSLPPASQLDAAVGDLNADGLPDVILSMNLLRVELFARSGHPDVALMNVGNGRFHATLVEPSAHGFSNGVTLADLDGDGRLDLIESNDLTSLADKSRILLNRTEPGDAIPTFVVSEHFYDTGTYGMGAAVEDINGDGILDIYNSSLGRDLVVLGQPDGSWLDATAELGFRHEWGETGLRNQWSPALIDLNGDGRLDVYVRQGGNGPDGGAMSSAAPRVGYYERDILYVRDEEDRFERVSPPFNQKVATRGRHAAIGDCDDDGLPDILHGGEVGSAGFWRNVTELAPTARPLTLRFESTVSGWPPTGARVTATCDGVSLQRSLDSGGNMGSTVATEIYLGSTGCAGPTTVEVHWPSGATTTQSVPASARVAVAQEPAWWSLDPAAPKTVTLDPSETGADQVCVGSPQGQWICCQAAQAPCTLEPPTAVGGVIQAKLVGQRAMALPLGEPRWRVTTVPAPPRPGEGAEVFIMYQGDPREFAAVNLGPGAPTLMQGLSTLSWSTIDEDSHTLRAFIEVPEGAKNLELTLFPLDLPNNPTWVMSTGSAIDSLWSTQHIYPYRIIGGVTEFWHLPVYTTLIHGESSDMASPFLELTAVDGSPIDITFSSDPMVLTRGRFLVDPASLVGVDSLVLRDLGGSFEKTFDIFPDVSLDEAMTRLDRVTGGVINPRLLSGGDVSSFMFSVLDAQGNYMPPEPELIEVEVVGAEMIEEPTTQLASYTMGGTIRTLPGTEPGVVRVFAVDGRLLGELPFTRRPRGDSGVSATVSTVEAQPLEGEEAPTARQEATHRVLVTARNSVGDSLGLSPEVDVEVSGGELRTPPVVSPFGNIAFLVAVAEEPGEMVIQVDLDGAALEPLVVPHDGHPFTSVVAADTSSADVGSDAEDSAETLSDAEVPPPEPRDSGGCAAGGHASTGMALWMLLLGLLLLRRRRALGISLVVSLVALTPRPAHGISFEDLSESTELTEIFTGTVGPVWFDADLDGAPEAMWISHQGWFAIDIDAQGEAQLKELSIPDGFGSDDMKSHTASVGPEVVTVVLDTDGDDQPEILLITDEVKLYRLISPWTFELEAKRAFALPPASVVDAAVGDLNADGLPDVVLGMALYRGEILTRSGHQDMALMNLGMGRFEIVPIEPAGFGLTNGVTLADVDGDHRLDIVESFDFTSVSDKSRILLNRTAPGDLTPTFEVSEHAYDSGTNGMGAAIADLNGDGLVDIYNSAQGRDLLVYGQPDGSWSDVTQEVGIFHEWGVSGLRNQWAPILKDLNGDGRLDIYVRQGGNGAGGFAMGVALAANERDLLYLGRSDGSFERLAPPHHQSVAHRGRQAATGDGNEDGLPDIAHGGEEGSAGFWLNATALSDAARPLTVRFDASVSGWPPTGARVSGTCAGQTVHRTLTSGGLVGSTSATEVYLGWESCAGERTVEVGWPSGVVTVQTVSAEHRVTTAVEPAWWSLDAASPGTVTLDPAAANVSEACVGSPQGLWVCCATQSSPCLLTPPEAVGGVQQAKLIGVNSVALPIREDRWTLATMPSPLRPGESAEIYVRFQGDPRRFDSVMSGPSAPSLFQDSESLTWSAVDATSQTLRTTIEVPVDAKTVGLTLFPFDLPTSPTWIETVASGIDPARSRQDIYPYRITGGVTEFWHIPVYTTLIRGQSSATLLTQLELVTTDDSPISYSLSTDPVALARGRFLVDPVSVTGSHTLVLRDTVGHFEKTFDIFPELSLEEALPHLDSVVGGLGNTRMVEDGEVSNVLISLRDAQGNLLPPEPELIELELDGAELLNSPEIQSSSYMLLATIRTLPGTTPGEVRVKSVDGRSLASFSFERRARGDSGVSLTHSTAEVVALEGKEAPEGPGQSTHRVQVVARHEIGDALGLNTRLDVSIQGGEQVTATALDPNGAMFFLVAVATEPGEMIIDISLDGAAFEQLMVPHEGHPFPGDWPEDLSSDPIDASSSDPSEIEQDTGPPSSAPRSSGGCDAGGSPLSGSLVWLVTLLGLSLLRRRARKVGLALGAATLLMGAAPAPAQFVSYGAELNLLEDAPEYLYSYLVPIWVDIDQDGAPEAVYIDIHGASAVDLDDSGSLVIVDVQIPSPVLKNAERPDLVIAVLDIDRDGVDEVVIITNVVHILEVTAPYQLTAKPVLSPSLPGASALDLAVGDLNGDGWPDMVVGFGVYTSDRMELRGTADVVLMNLGDGRLETYSLEPQRDGFSNGITLVDLNADGLPDVIESVDASPLVGVSRILMNTTQPGDRVPTFSVHPQTYDTGSYGMGAAVDDLDQDGYFDIYNTSVGRDLLAAGRADGGFDQVAAARGIVHEWGLHRGQRMQWSPSFSDLNADGLLDILVRQGATGAESGLGNGPWIARNASDLLYLQDDTGGFQRSVLPFDDLAASLGRQAVLGDLNQDGLRDVALGGQGNESDFWMNETVVPQSTRLLLLQFATTVSAHPPVGARIEASCAGLTRTRTLTSGGKMGGSAYAERTFAWPGCSESPTVTIAWPSGALSNHTVPSGQVLFIAQEPAWVTEGELGDTSVRLDPTGTGAQEVCLRQIDSSVACCALDEAPCEFDLVLGESGAPTVRLDERRAVALAAEEDRWSLTTDPPLPKPGGKVTFQVAHRGRASRFDSSAMTLIIDTEPEIWEVVDEDLRLLELTTTLPEGLSEVPLKLFPKDLLEPTWLLPTGTALDARWPIIDPYPYRILGGITELWHWSLYLNAVRHHPGNSVVHSLSFTTPFGIAVDGVWSHLTMSRSRLRAVVDWENLGGVKALVIHDGEGAVSFQIPVPPSLSLEEAAKIAMGTHGGLMKNRLVEGGDLSNVLVTLTDENGISMPPEPELISIELDGAELVDPLGIAGGSYDIFTTIRTLPGAGPGEIRARTSDGRVIGSWSFERRARVPCGVDLERSWTEFLERLPLDPPEVTHRLEVHPRNSFGETMGANVDLTVEFEGIDVIEPPRMLGTGNYIALVAPSPGATVMAATSTFDGVSGPRVEIVAPPTDPAVADIVDEDAGSDGVGQDLASDTGPTAESPPTPSSGSKSGCGAAGQGAPNLWFVWIFALGFARRLRSRVLGRAAWVALFVALSSPMAAAEPTSVVLEDLGTSLGLSSETKESRLAAWIDVDLDGAADPIWITYDGVHTLGVDGSGEPTLIEVSAPDLLNPKSGPRMSVAVLDVEGDGQDELLVVGQSAQILGVSAPYTLERKPYELPVLPAVLVIDMAVGDFNADGRVDVLLGLGIFSTERIERRGYPDMLLMNLGFGRFELTTVEPSRECYTHGLTAVDMNGDGRLDIVESCDVSYFVGPSRVLINQTVAGASAPTFEPTESIYDTGTFGMGAAVADIDNDGLLDIYNTNVGNDLVTLSTPSGSFEDVTFELGFDHEFGYGAGGRTQWSPTWSDLNLDGRYDLVVRQGSFGTSTPLPGLPGLAISGADLLYLGTAEGRFVRAAVPFDPDGPNQGRQAVLGDADKDGRFDVALGGLAGSGGYWRNDTPIPSQGRALTVELRGTVSGSPPIGAVVTGVCDGAGLVRRLTSGSHFGGMAANQVGFAWEDCASVAQLEVLWPSGATTHHEVDASSPYELITEPQWLVADPNVMDGLLVHPSEIAEPACYGTLSSAWTCCELNAQECAVPSYDESEESVFLQVGGGPVRLIRPGGVRWSLETSPSPPIPGESVTLRVHHVGSTKSFDPGSVMLFVDGSPRTAVSEDASRQMLEYKVEVPLSSGLEVAIFPPDLPSSPTWIVPTGLAMDPAWTRIDTYPYRILGGVTEFWEWATFVVIPRDRPTAVSQQLRIETPLGALLDSTLSVISVSMGRVRLLVPWASLEGLDSVVLRDGVDGSAWDLPLPGTKTMEEATSELTQIVGGIAKNRLLEGGDVIPVFMILLDEEGRIMSPEPAMIRIEADGAFLSEEPGMIPGSYDVYAFLETEPGVGPGEVRVLTADGRLLETFPFERRARGEVAVSAEHSFITLTPLEGLENPSTLHELRVAPMNSFGEPLGIACLATLEIEGGFDEESLELETSGHQIAQIRSDGTAPLLTVRVFASGVSLGEVSVEVPFTPPGQEEEPQGDVQDDQASGAESPESPPPSSGKRSSGCAGSVSAPAPELYGAMLLFLFLICRQLRYNNRQTRTPRYAQVLSPIPHSADAFLTRFVRRNQPAMRFRALSILITVALFACNESPVSPAPLVGSEQDEVSDVQVQDVASVDGVEELLSTELPTEPEEDCGVVPCPPDCGEYGTLDADRGECLCVQGGCADPWTGVCIAKYLESDYASVSIEKDVLAEIRTDLFERYVDVSDMRAHVYDRLAITENTKGTFRWEKFGYLLVSDHLCSLYQLGITEQDPYYAQAILDAVQPGDIKMYMPLVLSSIVTGRVDQCVLHGIIDSLVEDLEKLLLEEPSHTKLLALKGALTRYLVTIDFYDIEFDTTLVGTVSELLYPVWTVENYGVWDSALVYDLVNAYYLDLNVNEPEILLALDNWWQELGGVDLVDCVGDICPIKGMHQVVFIDAMLGIIPEDKLVQIASLLLSNIGADGSYGFPAVLGLDPSILWDPSYCDIFCSSKHWHITFALNHLLARLEHREADIKAGVQLLEL